MESQSVDGVTEINYQSITGMESGKMYYVWFKLKPISIGENARASCRITLYDADGKFIKHYFSPASPIKDVEVQDFLYPFDVPAETAKAQLTLWLGGVQKTVVDNVSIDSVLPSLGNTDGNLIFNGSFESPAMLEYYIRPTYEGKDYKENDGKVYTERDTLKVKSGKYSLLCSSELEKATNEINLNVLPYVKPVKYRFSVSYFIGSAEGKVRFAGRITYWDKNRKVLGYQFPEGDVTPGKWHEMKLEFFPPAGTARISITLWPNGKMKLWLDDIYFGEIKEKAVANQSAGAFVLAQNSDFVLWKEVPYLKPPVQGVPDGIKQSAAVALSAAANELEPFQLIVSSKKKFTNLHLSFTDLKSEAGVIPAENLSYKITGFINLKNPDNPAIKGLNADPLLPDRFAEAMPGRNLPFYVAVNVPKDQKSGTYRGNIKLMSGSQEIASVPLELRVRSFALPDTPHLRTYFYGQANASYREFDNRPAGVINENIQKLLQEHRMTGNQAQWPPRPKWKIEDGKLTVTDWTEFDTRVEKWHSEYGMRNVPAPVFTMLGDNYGWWGGDRSKPGASPFNGYSWASKEGLKYAGELAKQFTDHVKERFPDVNFYAYLYDEPPAKVYTELAKITNALHQAAPDLKIFIPKQVSKDIGYVQTWCVPMSPGYLHPNLQKAELEAGRDIWYYNWVVRLDPYDYIRGRLYTWQIYSADGNGGLLWNTVFNPKGINPWNDFEKTHSCGGATIFYPPRKEGEEMIPSLRAAQVREGIDDFDYLRILENKIDSLFPGQGKARVKEIIRALIPQMPFEYKNDPHLLYALRDRIADEIESLDQAPVAMAISNPPENSSTEISELRFSVFGPAGAQVLINDKAAGKIGADGRLDVPFVLGKLGQNAIKLAVNHNGKSKVMVRQYKLEADPQIRELRTLLSKCTSAGVDVSEINTFLSRIDRQNAYTAAERQEAEKLIASTKYKIVSKSLDGRKTFTNPLSKAIFERARSAFARKQFERAEYYLALSGEAAKAGDMNNFAVKVQAADYANHPAFTISNGVISATVMETGGRIISFKVQGVECLVPGSFKNGLSLAERAAQKTSKDMITRLHGYGGYEDAGGDGIWPVSFVDWDVRFLELKSSRVAVSFTTQIPDTPYRLRRTLSMDAGSADLKMDYEITNILPKGMESDDPEHYQLAWRGRFMPGIGSGTDAAQNDYLVLPVKSEDKLAESHFTFSKPASYERRSIKLLEPWMGAFDPALKTGIAMIGDSVITHAYVWFNSKGDRNGNGKVYTLEFPRSFYGRVYNDPNANKPLTIKPGESMNFQLTLRGISGIEDEQQFIQKVKKK
ncbi:MAG: glycoside hydrolase domain-containing protein, partial [Armatimonadota bacterium]